MAFLKTGPVSSAEMFAAEAEGLIELAKPGVIRVPDVLDYGIRNNQAFIEIEHLKLEPASPVASMLLPSLTSTKVVAAPVLARV